MSSNIPNYSWSKHLDDPPISNQVGYVIIYRYLSSKSSQIHLLVAISGSCERRHYPWGETDFIPYGPKGHEVLAPFKIG